MPISKVAAAIVLALTFSSVVGASAQDRLGRRDRAIALAHEGRCQIALTLLAEFRGVDPQDDQVERLTGECALRLQRFGLAVDALERARSLDPTTDRVDLHLAMAYFHLGRIEAAGRALGRAERVDATAPEFLLYSGLIALERSDYPLAASRLDAASQLTDRPPEPMASFYLGRALSELEEPSKAIAAFERVIRDYPNTSWSLEAARALDRLRADSAIGFWASAEIGIEHDDNALLRGRGVGLPTEISGQSDQRGVWFMEIGSTLEVAKAWNAGALFHYSGSAHRDLKDFNTNAPGGTLWLDRTLGQGGDSLRLQYDIDAAFINESPFVLSHRVAASFFHPWKSVGQTIVATTFDHSDYDYDRFAVPDADAAGNCPSLSAQCSPLGVDERGQTNRTGNGLGANIVHHLPIPFDMRIARNGWIEGGYGYQRYWAEGREYDHQRHQVELEAGVELPLSVSMRVGGRFARIAYDHATVFPDPSAVAAAPAGRPYALGNRKRRETETGVWVVLERELADSMVLSASYRRTRNRSNADVFDYDRNVFGLSLRVGFGG